MELDINAIKQAFAIHAEREGENSCVDCPYNEEMCSQKLARDTLALIDRYELRIKAAYKNGYEQGVKDFAERVKTYYEHNSSRPLPATVVYYIDQIAKELKGDKNE